LGGVRREIHPRQEKRRGITYEPEKWQKLGKGPESPEVDKYLLHFAKSRVQRLAKQLKSCKELRKNKMDEKREVNVENTKKHQVYMIEQLSHTVMVASRFKD